MIKLIVGCGDVGRRLASQLIEGGTPADEIIACNATGQGNQACMELGLSTHLLDLDNCYALPDCISSSLLFYLVPPQRDGDQDLRSTSLIQSMIRSEQLPNKVVLISTTGVYGDCEGRWVSEQSTVKPGSARAKRRLNAEQQWSVFCQSHAIGLSILRVPGIYSNSRIPVQRINQGLPVVNPKECGYSNRIHADDLARMMIAAMQSEAMGAEEVEIYNCSDGTPSNISDYLQAAARVAGLAALPVISMQEARQQLSPEMLIYLTESRKISNRKILSQLKVTLRYPDFRVGLRH